MHARRDDLRFALSALVVALLLVAGIVFAHGAKDLVVPATEGMAAPPSTPLALRSAGDAASFDHHNWTPSIDSTSPARIIALARDRYTESGRDRPAITGRTIALFERPPPVLL